jgi:predicted metalloenzyme YecM
VLRTPQRGEADALIWQSQTASHSALRIGFFGFAKSKQSGLASLASLASPNQINAKETMCFALAEPSALRTASLCIVLAKPNRFALRSRELRSKKK